MKAAQELQRIRRILVAVDACTHGVSALDAAVQLAAQLHAELVGLFIEDTNLLRLAGLPFAREWSSTTVARRLESGTLNRTLRNQAEQMQQLLARSASQYQVHWTFRVARGEIAAQVQQMAEEVDLVAVGIRAWEYANPVSLETATRKLLRDTAIPMLLLPQGIELQLPMICVYTGSTASGQALQLAKHLMTPSQAVTVILMADDSQRASLLQQQVQQAIGLQPVTWRHARANIDALLTTLAQLPAGSVLLPGDSTSLSEDERDTLLRKSQRAVIVVQ